MPHTPTMSASGASGTDSTFSSTIATCHCGGHRAASVASPSGGLIARLPGSTSSTAHLKLQKLSGYLGLISSSFMSSAPYPKKYRATYPRTFGGTTRNRAGMPALLRFLDPGQTGPHYCVLAGRLREPVLGGNGFPAGAGPAAVGTPTRRNDCRPIENFLALGKSTDLIVEQARAHAPSAAAQSHAAPDMPRIILPGVLGFSLIGGSNGAEQARSRRGRGGRACARGRRGPDRRRRPVEEIRDADRSGGRARGHPFRDRGRTVRRDRRSLGLRQVDAAEDSGRAHPGLPGHRLSERHADRGAAARYRGGL